MGSKRQTALDTWARSGQEIRTQSTELKQASQEEIKLRGSLKNPEGLSKPWREVLEELATMGETESSRQRTQLQIGKEFPVFRNHTNKRPLYFSLVISLPHLTLAVTDRHPCQVWGCQKGPKNILCPAKADKGNKALPPASRNSGFTKTKKFYLRVSISHKSKGMTHT